MFINTHISPGSSRWCFYGYPECSLLCDF